MVPSLKPETTGLLNYPVTFLTRL